MEKGLKLILIQILSTLGVIDSAWLTYEHFSRGSTACSVGFLSSCNAVLTSTYSEIYGIPLALLGFLHYLLLTLLIIMLIRRSRLFIRMWVFLQTTFGIIFSLYLVYLQLIVIGSICVFCMASAVLSIALFVLVLDSFDRERVGLVSFVTNAFYKNIIKPALFLIDAEKVHESTVEIGEILGKSFIKKVFAYFYRADFVSLNQNLAGIEFGTPIGLAAGFDYDAKLTQFLPSLGFGFASVGTVTNMAYKGNRRPMLGRLPKSKSLMVNKGFKSSGAEKIAEKLSHIRFEIPVGISVGRTNSLKIKTQKQSVEDIAKAFEAFEKKGVENDFYELNISCPNLKGDIDFYSKTKLNQLTKKVDSLGLSKPYFIKMPIELDDKNILRLLDTIDKSNAAGVIFGNLQKNKKHERLDKTEVSQFKKGYFSGKPTFERSNELISLAYKNYKDRFIIIGCGGVFSAEDAYEKISRGASLVQLITGLVYEGPQLVTQINIGLARILKKKGFKSVKEAVGSGL